MLVSLTSPMDCEDPPRFLMKDGRDGDRVAEGVGESGLFPGGIGCKRANSRQERKLLRRTVEYGA